MAQEALTFVGDSYSTDAMVGFVSSVSDALKIVFKTNLDINEGLSNLIFCVFSSFYPELLKSIKLEERQAKEDEKARAEGGKDVSKYQIKMMPLADSKSKFTLFRNAFYMSERIEELSRFCLANKRIINKMIKQKPSLFVNELEGLIKYMPNLLDFENKRTYFKKELAKLKRSNMHD